MLAALAQAPLSLPAFADGDAVAIEDIEPTPEMILTSPSTEHLIRDGDESVVDTLFVYLDGCPLLSITPDENRIGPPSITYIDPTEGCSAVARDVPDVSPAAVWQAGGGTPEGLRIRLMRDDAADYPDGEDTLTPASMPRPGTSIIVDIESLKDDPVFADGTPRGIPGIPAIGPVTPFIIPDILGGSPAGPGVVPVSVSGVPGNPFNPGGGGSGGRPNGSLTPNGGQTPEIAAVPLPYTLIMLFGALYALRRMVRRA